MCRSSSVIPKVNHLWLVLMNVLVLQRFLAVCIQPTSGLVSWLYQIVSTILQTLEEDSDNPGRVLGQPWKEPRTTPELASDSPRKGLGQPQKRPQTALEGALDNPR